MAVPHIGEYGFTLRTQLTKNGVAVDISSASSKEIHLAYEGVEVAAKTASFTTDGTDGYLEYDLVDGDFDKDGSWEYRGMAVVGARKYKNDWEKVYVTR